MIRKRKGQFAALLCGLLLGAGLLVAIWQFAVHTQAGATTAACGKGTIAFEPLLPRGAPPRPECLLTTYYDQGKRGFVSNLLRPARSHQLKLVVVHTADDTPQNETPKGETLSSQYVYIRNPDSTVVRGTVNFSAIQRVRREPPFGKYYVSIYRLFGVTGQELLAVGEFDVMED